ncbi:MAG: type II toxin-antitoxin system RelE family toxin [Chloroflexota bacterium]
MPYRIEITPTALEALRSIADGRTRSNIVRGIDSLADEPEKRGSRLRRQLASYRSVRAAGQRYRVVYWIDEEAERVVVCLVGIRRSGSRHDVYALAQRLVRRGLL